MHMCITMHQYLSKCSHPIHTPMYVYRQTGEHMHVVLLHSINMTCRSEPSQSGGIQCTSSIPLPSHSLLMMYAALYYAWFNKFSHGSTSRLVIPSSLVFKFAVLTQN